MESLLLHFWFVWFIEKDPILIRWHKVVPYIGIVYMILLVVIVSIVGGWILFSSVALINF